jgi:hypothetical protein
MAAVEIRLDPAARETAKGQRLSVTLGHRDGLSPAGRVPVQVPILQRVKPSRYFYPPRTVKNPG